MSDDPTNWASIVRGECRVTYGKPFYGKRKIIANAPLSANNFDALIEALKAAKALYLEEPEQAPQPEPPRMEAGSGHNFDRGCGAEDYESDVRAHGFGFRA
jgi:hypothetical protein